MKKTVLLLVLIMLPIVIDAYDIRVNRIYYNIDTESMTAEVTSGDYAYIGKIKIPSSISYDGYQFDVKKIANRAFYNSEITSIEIAEGITSIDVEAFEGSENLKTCSLPHSLIRIGACAFWNCSNLLSIVIPEKITKIEVSAFAGCQKLKTVEFPENLKYIEGGAFAGCSSLELISFPDKLEEIRESAFLGCKSLTFASLPSNLKYIYESCFSGCENIESVQIPEGITTLYYGTFSNCTKLQQVSLPTTLRVLNGGGEYVGGCHGIFSGCTKLTYLSIPEGVTEIKAGSLMGMSAMQEIELPSTLTSIGEYAFNNCENISIIKLNDKTPFSINSNVFMTIVKEQARLIVPFNTRALYMMISGWKEFNNIEEAPGIFKLIYKVDNIEYKNYDIEYGNSITPEPAPTKEGHTFSGWSEIPETMPAHDVTITGSFSINKYKLTYKVDDTEYKTYEIEYGATITSEANPEKEGYTFSGWSEIPETMPAHDVTVIGTFSINKYKLSYMVDGEEYKTYEVEYGATITPETKPEKEGYTFYGWSDIPKTMPAHDVIVTGTFNINKYELIYIVDNETYQNYHIMYGTIITPEAEPTKEGYTFSGWSEIPETMPAHDVTVTGSFNINSYKLTYMIDNDIYKETTYEYGATIAPEPQPEGDYTSFEWIGLPKTMPAHDVIVHANYEITGIINTSDIEFSKCQFYSIDGKRIGKPLRGLNIVKNSDGTTRKAVMK